MEKDFIIDIIDMFDDVVIDFKNKRIKELKL